MKKIIIAKCVRCGGLLLHKAGAKTKTCPYCNLRFRLDTSEVVACLSSAEEAQVALADLKKRQADKQTGPVRKFQSR